MPTIIYQETPEGITPHQLRGFFVGWDNPPSPETHLRLLEGSDHVVLALDRDQGRVIGFVTAITDGVLNAYIPLLEVLPDYQAEGVGSELVRRMLRRLKGLYAVDLLCDPSLQPYYSRFNMMPVAGMMLRRYEHQPGAKHPPPRRGRSLVARLDRLLPRWLGGSR